MNYRPMTFNSVAVQLGVRAMQWISLSWGSFKKQITVSKCRIFAQYLIFRVVRTVQLVRENLMSANRILWMTLR